MSSSRSMRVLDIVLVSLALLAPVLGQDLACQAANGANVFTVYDQADVDEIARSCAQGVRSDMRVAPAWLGPLDLSSISSFADTFGFTASNVPGLTSVSAPSLTEIGGSFYFYNCPELTNVSLPTLRSAAGGFSAHTTPKLNVIDLSDLRATTGSYPSSYFVLFDTNLSEIGGLELGRVGSITIQQNPQLAMANLTGLTDVSHNLTVSQNHDDFGLLMPNTTTVGNLSLANVASVEMPSVTAVSGSLILENNTFETVAMQNLVSIQDIMTIQDNADLFSLSFPKLLTVGTGFDFTYNPPKTPFSGALTVVDNPLLKMFDPNLTFVPSLGQPGTSGFSHLMTIIGDVIIRGPFASVDLPSLGTVYGYLDIESTNSSFSCVDYDRRVWQSDSLHTLNVESSNYTCRAASPGSSQDVAAHCCRPMPTGTKVGIGIGAALGGLLVLSIAVGCCFREQIRKRMRIAKVRRAEKRHARTVQRSEASRTAAMQGRSEALSPGETTDSGRPAGPQIKRERDAGPYGAPPPAYEEATGASATNR